MSDPTRRVFFAHAQKTAGTSLVFGLRRHFARDAIYPGESDGDAVTGVLSVDHLLARWPARRDAIRVVAGHFPLCTVELLDGDFTTIVLLREPVERTLSYLRHHREVTPADRDLSLEEVYEDPLRFHGLIHNHMVKMLSLTPAEMTAGVLTQVEFDRDRLERAKANLATVDVVGLQERFTDFWDELRTRHGLRLGEPDHTNRTRPVEVAPELRARIAADNALDAELYEFARELCEDRYRVLDRG